MVHILLIEDDAAIAKGLRDNLEFEGYHVATAGDGAAGLQMIEEHAFDLVILDLLLPKIHGFDVLRGMRKAGSDVPVLILTARSDEADRVHGLDLGADDYVSKPFSIQELLARVRALLRRRVPAQQHPAGSGGAGEPPQRLDFGDAEIDFARWEARRSGAAVEMTRKEFGIVRFLAAHEGMVVTREQVLEELWGREARLATTRTVDNHIASLRAKLEPNPAEPQYFRTVHGVGYKFVRGGGQ